MKMPCSARKISNAPNVGEKAHKSVGTLRNMQLQTMTGLRPSRSLSRPLAIDAKAIMSTTADTESAAVAGGTENSCESSGSMGCVRYISAKTTTAAAYNANIAERLCAPCKLLSAVGLVTIDNAYIC